MGNMGKKDFVPRLGWLYGGKLSEYIKTEPKALSLMKECVGSRKGGQTLKSLTGFSWDFSPQKKLVGGGFGLQV